MLEFPDFLLVYQVSARKLPCHHDSLPLVHITSVVLCCFAVALIVRVKDSWPQVSVEKEKERQWVMDTTEHLAPHWHPLAKGAAVPVHFGPLEFVVWAEGIA